MKNYFLLFILLTPGALSAQCPFSPTVSPANVILCPNATDTLFTQVYDAYQWYQDNTPIAGATNQSYVVTSAGSYYRVAATLDTCTELSPQVLVDGWVFLLPYVIHSGDYGVFDPDLFAIVLCKGDTLILTMGQPYDTNVQWFNNGDTIAGATGTSLFISETGVYTACGAPSVCPGYISCLGVDVAVVVMDPTPVITQSNDTLLSNLSADSYQWFLNGNLIPGATNSFYVPFTTGEYTVGAHDAWGCKGTSVPYFITITGVENTRNPSSFALYPTVTSGRLYLSSTVGISSITLYDHLGRPVLHPEPGPEGIDISGLPAGVYFLQAQFKEHMLCRKFIRD